MMCDGDSCRWNKNSNGIVNVPYIISKDYDSSEVSIIINAMQDFETLTCVNFIPRTVEADYLQIKSESGCWSYIGKTGRPQDLSLESGSCVKKGIIQHELNHVLGFYHEQSRSDRDDYIDIIAANIIPDAVKNFGKMATDNMDLDYDYSSVMHYGRYDFSKKPGFATIVPKPDPSVSIGQRYGLSNLDISKINKLYDCGTCSTLLPDSTGTLMSANYPKKYPSNVNCVWLIRAPYGQIFLEFSVFDVQSSSGCDSDYLKVYDGASRSSPVLLYRTCGTKQLPSLVSSTNVMLLEFVSGKGKKSTGFKASYTTVQCGYIVTTSPGFIHPPYSTSLLDCIWIITAPTGFKVSLDVNQFDMGPESISSNANLQIFDGPLSTSPQIGEFCCDDVVPSILSSWNSLLVHFHNDGSKPYASFVAIFTFVKSR